MLRRAMDVVDRVTWIADGVVGVMCSPLLRAHHRRLGHEVRWDRCVTCHWVWVAFSG